MGLALMALTGWFLLRNKLYPDEEKTAETSVRVAVVERGDLASEISFAGDFRPWYVIDLQARVAGFIRNLRVDLGSCVREGDILAELEVPLLKEDLLRAEAVLRRSREEANRASAVYQEAHLASSRLLAVAQVQAKLLAAQDLDSAQAKDRTAEASLAVAREQVQVADAELARLKAEMDNTKMIAPFDGVVVRLLANPGDSVQGGLSPSGQAKALVRLAQINRLRLSFPVSIVAASSLREGEALEIRLDNGRVLTNRIARLSRDLSSSTRMMEVEADVPNERLELVPGIYATVVLHPERRQNVLWVPIEAVHRQPSPRVWVVASDQTVAERSIRLGLETPLRVEIMDGLREGDLVVTGGSNRLKVGQKVIPKKAEISPAVVTPPIQSIPLENHAPHRKA